jgi:hypothetical protein
LAQSTAFVVELPPGRPSPKRTARLARAVQQLAGKPSSGPDARRPE